MKERLLEYKCRQKAEAAGGFLVKWVSPGRAGVPDRILLMPDGIVWFIEFKQPGKKLTPLQDAWRQRLTDRGHRHAIISDIPAFETLLSASSISG